MFAIQQIKKSLEKRNLILFIGAGIPATLNLPTWAGLIDQMATELQFDTRLFKKYGDNLTLAEYYEITRGNIGKLSNWMRQEWKVRPETIRSSPIYRSLVEMNCPIIYTTNYDHTLEMAFESYEKEYKSIVAVEDLVGISPSATQIVKFHGDFTNDQSIVLTERSYFDRLDFESPLDIKFRADILGRSILFIGYSLSDINIRLLIYKLDQLWKKSNNGIKRPNSYIFLPTPNPIQELILESRGIQPIIGQEADKTKSTECFLNECLK